MGADGSIITKTGTPPHHPPLHFGRGTTQGNEGSTQPTADDTVRVKRLGEIVSRALNTPEPEAGAYRYVSLPGIGDLRAIAAAFGKTAIGYRLAPVLKGTKSPFSTIGGVTARIQLEMLQMNGEELMMSTDYSDKEAWAQMLMGQLLQGTSRLRGPPGLLEEMQSLLSASTVQEMTSRCLEGTTLIPKIKGG